MRIDQYAKLQDLAEKLTDAFIGEADPDKWPGAGLEPGQMDQQTRGDRYWCKKNAAATLSVIVRTTSLIGIIQQRSNLVPTDDGGVVVQFEGGGTTEGSSIDAEIKSAEKEASKLLAKMQKTMQAASGK